MTNRTIANLPMVPIDLAPRPLRYDRAAVVTTAILQILQTAPREQRRPAVEGYLRDELASIEPSDFDKCSLTHTSK
jgi:hypothetical protein